VQDRAFWHTPSIFAVSKNKCYPLSQLSVKNLWNLVPLAVVSYPTNINELLSAGSAGSSLILCGEIRVERVTPKRLGIIIALIVTALLAIVILQNIQFFETRISFVTIAMPQALLLAVTLPAGFGLGVLTADKIVRKKNKD